MARREIHPVTTQRAGDSPVPADKVPPPIAEQIAVLAEAQETTLSTPANDPARTAALTRVRALLARLRGGA